MAKKDGSTAEPPRSSLNAKFFNNPKYSDVTIKIFDETLHAHQLVICDQSEYFDRTLQKGSQKIIEAGTKTLEFREGSGAAYWRALEYLYTGDYSDKISTTKLTDDPRLLIDVRVYALADKFSIEGLKTLSEIKFEKRIQDCQMDSAFITCVREVYKNTHSADSEMRHVVVEAITSKSKEMAKDPFKDGFQQNIFRFRLLIREGGDFAEEYMLQSIGLQIQPTHVEEPMPNISQIRIKH
ncbi:hypothetical protein K3495_g11389 [Podosphaera aphanis]|nr:hypothetical protein K3495_g11389 [Podosphaera aphanis]